MTQDYKTAEAACIDAQKMFDAALDRMIDKEKRLSETAKKTSGNIRAAANDLVNGLNRVEQVANFERLEKYVSVLERAASALTVLAELEKGGKLERIANAVKV